MTSTNDNLKSRLDVVEQILDVHEGSCEGSPLRCGRGCSDASCPFTSNRVKELGDLVLEALGHTKWLQAAIDELTVQGVLAPNTTHRIDKRVRLRQLQDKLAQTNAIAGIFPGVSEHRDALQSEVDDLIRELGETP